MTKLSDFIEPVHASVLEDENLKYDQLDMSVVKASPPEELLNRFKALRKANRKVDDLWTNKIDMKPSRSERDFALAKELKSEGWSLHDTAIILWHYKHGKVREAKFPAREIIRCYERSGNDFSDPLPQEYIDRIAAQTNPILAERNKSTISEGEQPKRLKAIPLGTDTGRVSGNPLLKGLIDKNTITVIYGQSNVGKSFVASDIAGHVAAGLNWGKHKLTEKMGVIYISAEAGASYGKRGVALKRRLNKENAPLTDFPFEYVAQGVNFLSEKQDLKDVVLLARRQQAVTGYKVGMIVVDTLATTFSGGNENSSDDMGRFIDNMKWIQEHADCSVVIVHHSGKDQAAGARGHSSLRAATDTELEVIAEKRGEKYFRQIRTRKQRDGESDTAIKFGLQVAELWQDEDGDVVTTCYVVLEEDGEFDDVTPDIEDELDSTQKAALRAIRLYDEAGLPNIKNPIGNFTEKQIKVILFNDIIRGNNLFADGDLSEISKMAKPVKNDFKPFERACDVLADRGITNLDVKHRLIEDFE